MIVLCMDTGRRAHYRVQPDESSGLHVTLENPGEAPLTGSLVDVSASGAGVHFAVPDCPELTIGQEVDLVFSSEKLGSRLRVAATVQHRAEEDDDARRYGFRFLQPQQLELYLPPNFRELFNRRRAWRATPDPYGHHVPVTLQIGEDELPLEVRLENISPLGAGISLDPQLEHAFVKTTEVQVAVHLPDSRHPVTFEGRIRYRRLVGRSIYYGIEFDAGSTENFERQQAIVAKYVSKCERDWKRGAA